MKEGVEMIHAFMLLVSTLTADTDQTINPAIPFFPRQYVCIRANKPLVIDGELYEAAWAEAPWTQEFLDIEGPDKPEPWFKTRAKMLWDEDYFYIAAELEEPHVWANLTERDSIIFHDNDFEVFIDPDGDTHHYYEIEMNALNTVWDLYLDKPYRDGCKPLFFWDIRGLRSAVKVDGTINDPSDKDTGWTVELALPWKVLQECAPEGRPPKTGEQWRVGFSRVEWRTEVKDGKYVKVRDPDTGKILPEQNWVWSPQGKINMHMPEMWGFVQFSDKTTAVDEFVFNPEEYAKWALRLVYYREKAHRDKEGRFTAAQVDLGLGEVKVKGFRWPPVIRFTESLFEARLVSEDGETTWHIDSYGRVWK
jgi:hypothetical protein